MLVGKAVRINGQGAASDGDAHLTVAAVSFRQQAEGVSAGHVLLLIDHRDGEVVEYTMPDAASTSRIFVDRHTVVASTVMRDQLDALTLARDSLQQELAERTREREEARDVASRFGAEVSELRDRLDQIRQAEHDLDNIDDPHDSDAPVGVHVPLRVVTSADADRVDDLKSLLDVAITRLAAILIDVKIRPVDRGVAASDIADLIRMRADLDEYDIHAASARSAFLDRVARRVGAI